MAKSDETVSDNKIDGNKTEAAQAMAKEAHLRYVTDQIPGISRVKTDEGFRYTDTKGEVITDAKTLARIAGLVIPPAYTDVWICPYANGHLQVTARDAKGRKQYRYHERWRMVRDGNKYDRMVAFGDALPTIRARVASDLAKSGLPREKVLAAIVRLLETTKIRIGNAEYAQQNGSFGLTTLHNDHVEVEGAAVHFSFRGKAGKFHTIAMRDKRVANIVRKCQEIPGQELFGYVDPDTKKTHDVTSGDVNAYLHETAGAEFTAKDFRTWAGTVLCATTLCAAKAADTNAARKQVVAGAVKQVSRELGNTPTVCRQCYIHPAILTAYNEGLLATHLALPQEAVSVRGATDLTPAECAVLTFLRKGW